MAQKKKRKRGPGRKGPGPYIIITAVIVILLAALLIILKKPVSDKAAEEGRPGDMSVPAEKVPEKPEKPSGKAPAVMKPAGIPEKPEPEEKGSIVFIIDDVGNSVDDLKPFLELPFPITFAVMPGRPYTSECAGMITAAGKEYILHQPMEAVDGNDPGAGAIFTYMDDAEIRRILEQNFAQLPDAAGMNNHMGSKATSDAAVMNSVMAYLAENGKFFLDSYTISGSLASGASEIYDVDYIRRNSMFLDNDTDYESLHNAINEGKKTASAKGHAVMIGHVMTEELAEALMELYPSFIEDGFTLKEISELFLDMNRAVSGKE